MALVSANIFAAKRVIKITQAWRNARIGDVIQKTRTAVNIIKHPPPRLRVFAAPFQILGSVVRPVVKAVGRVRGVLEEKAKLTAGRYEMRRMLFEQSLVDQTQRILTTTSI